MSSRRPWLRPLVPLYHAALAIDNTLRNRGPGKAQTLVWPVISVGSLSAGGAGKTPVVIALAELLRDAGRHMDVLSRGYGRNRRAIEQVIPDATNAAARFGDEPVLIAKRTGIPVWVGANRFMGGQAAESASPTDQPCIHFLDDGFQHRELARNFDIVLVTAEDLDDSLLPAGNLREPFTALARADAVVVREDELDVVAPRIWPLLREGGQVWTVRRRLRFPEPLGVLGAGLRPLAFCAIARPVGFAASLEAAGCGVIEIVIFRDHQPLLAKQIAEIISFAKQLNATGFVTTEKDFVKLAPEAQTKLKSEVGPLVVVALDAEFVDPAKVLHALTTRLALQSSTGEVR